MPVAGLPGSDTRSKLLTGLMWALPFALVLYLALRGGGYEGVVRDQATAILWIGILVAAAAGFLPAVRVSRAAWIALGLLGAFLAWTALSAAWSDSVERSVDSVALVGAYLAVFALSVMTSGRDAVVRVVGAVGAAIAVVAALALLSRFFPELFPKDEAAARIPEVAARLKYPLGSWNGLAGLIAMGVPLLLAIVFEAKATAARAVAAAAIPLCVLAIGYTISRGGMIAAVLAAAVFVALRPRRVAMLPMIVLLAAGTLVLVFAAGHFDALRNLTPGFEDQQVPMLVIALAASIATGAGAIGIIAAERSGRLRMPEASPRASRRALIAAAAVAALIAVGVVASGEASNAWERFKDPAAPGETVDRLSSGSGNQRYQQWDAALAAAREDPVGGKGAGTYEYWWARTSTVPGYSRYAHSLYFETLAETGFVGMALIVGLVVFILVALVRRALDAPAQAKGWLAAAAGSAAAFALTMGIDWSWNIAVVPVAFFLVSGAALQFGTAPSRAGGRAKVITRIALAGAAVGVTAVAGTSWYGEQRLVDSQQAVQAGDLSGALAAAEDAESARPYAATPHLQQALVLEEQGDFEAAILEVSTAADKDFYDWEPRYVMSRIEEQRGDLVDSKLFFERARQLNPMSPIFLDDTDESALTPSE